MNKLPTLYKRNTNDSIQQWTIYVKDNSYWVEQGKLNGKIVITHPHYTESKNVGKSNKTSPEEQALLEATALWDKKVKTGYFENINDIDNDYYFRPMLAESFSDYSDRFSDPKYPLFKFPVIVQKKLNGFRCCINSKGAFSRKGEQYHNIQHIIDELNPLFKLFPNLQLDGELYNFDHREHLNRMGKLITVTRKKTDLTKELIEESRKVVQYHIYDAINFTDVFSNEIDANTECINRIVAYKNLIEGKFKYSFAIQSDIADDITQIDNIVNGYIKSGEEGGIIRLQNAPYENKRSQFLLKYKLFKDGEYEISEILEGTGNWKDCAKAALCKLTTGEQFKTNIEGSMEFLKEVWVNKEYYKGKIITVRYQNLSEYGIPQIPYTDLTIRNEIEG